jgi:hypothetical protein
MGRKGSYKSRKSKRRRAVYVEYHSVPFAKFHGELYEKGFNHGPHQARAEFWSLVPSGQYGPERGRELVLSYLTSVETKLAAILSRNSISYFFHVYRRLAPYSVGDEKRPLTIALVRMALEAAIQKYALPGQCGRVGVSTEVPPEAIFNGFLVNDPRLWSVWGPRLRLHPQLVLTDFGAPELAEFYMAEKLAYEIWKSSAILRALGKGAPLRVFDSGEYFADDRSSVLDELLKRYDERDRFGNVSATGTVYSSFEDGPDRGVIVLPIYNVRHEPWERFKDLFRGAFRLNLTADDFGQQNDAPNFIWVPFNLLSFYKAHEPFAGAFQQTHGFGLKSAVAVLAAVATAIFRRCFQDNGYLIRQWCRAYDGPATLQDLIVRIREVLPHALSFVPLGIDATDVEVEAAVSFFSWSEESRSRINLVVAGPHSFFLPSVDDRIFADYAWIAQRLYRLFHGLTLDDQNFKGDALEVLVRNGRSALPVKACKGADGTSKQIDAAFDLGELLLIVECKVKAISVGWERGDPFAVAERQRFVYDAIRQADDKAIWLSHRAIGLNYDISKFKWVLAIVVTPFAEFIWATEEYYWINEKIPRIMTVPELSRALQQGILASAGAHHQMAMPVRAHIQK